MWTDATREKYEREAHRYASDLSDTEWCVIEPHMPPARALGRPRKTDMREVMTAILYMARSGCQWRMLPGEFPPRSSVQYYFYKWRDDGTWQEVIISSYLSSPAACITGKARLTPMMGVWPRSNTSTAASFKRRKLSARSSSVFVPDLYGPATMIHIGT